MANCCSTSHPSENRYSAPSLNFLLPAPWKPFRIFCAKVRNATSSSHVLREEIPHCAAMAMKDDRPGIISKLKVGFLEKPPGKIYVLSAWETGIETANMIKDFPAKGSVCGNNIRGKRTGKTHFIGETSPPCGVVFYRCDRGVVHGFAFHTPDSLFLKALNYLSKPHC